MKTVDLLLALSGGIFVLASAIGLHFWKFWMKTGDRLFVYLALAFWVFAVERCLLIGMTLVAETHPTVYLVRLASFIFIAAGIIDKNRAKPR